jgi:hypothetical protein
MTASSLPRILPRLTASRDLDAGPTELAADRIRERLRLPRFTVRDETLLRRAPKTAQPAEQTLPVSMRRHASYRMETGPYRDSFPEDRHLLRPIDEPSPQGTRRLETSDDDGALRSGQIVF